MSRWVLWRFWKRLRDFCERRMKDAYFMGGNSDQKCPNCKRWQHQGCRTRKQDFLDGSTDITCEECEHTWKAIFTPAGFVAVSDFK